MIKAHHERSRAFAMLEYVGLIIILMAGLFTFGPYIQRGLQGQYRKAGEGFAFTRQYNPGSSVECVYDDKQKIWYSQACYSNEVLKRKCSMRLAACQEPEIEDCARFCAKKDLEDMAECEGKHADEIAACNRQNANALAPYQLCLDAAASKGYAACIADVKNVCAQCSQQ